MLYEMLDRLHGSRLTLLIAKQSIQLALELAHYAYVLKTGRNVFEGPAGDFAKDPQVKRVYLGVSDGATVLCDNQN